MLACADYLTLRSSWSSVATCRPGARRCVALAGRQRRGLSRRLWGRWLSGGWLLPRGWGGLLLLLLFLLGCLLARGVVE